ncbi:MAG: aminotransferase class V-fold PLP-dependent enzyme [Flavobacteriales bacterium Tduv]
MLSQEEIHHIRRQFPILTQTVYGKPWIYLDNAATTQKPKQVLQSIMDYYTTINSNVHRGVHHISQLATSAMERSRERLQKFIHAASPHEIIFTRGTTEAINLVASNMKNMIKAGDEIIVSQLEHHSNIVPWQMLCQRTGALLRVIPIDRDGALEWEIFESLLSKKTKIVAINQISNVLGIINPIRKIIQKAHEYNAWVLIDGAQAPCHIPINVQELDADFYAFSAHKMYGPTGMGLLYGKENILETYPPYQGGGEMIKEVTFEKTTYADLPFRFEAGTPNIEGIIAWNAAIDFIEQIGLDQIQLYETRLLNYVTERLSNIEALTIYGHHKSRSGIISFNLTETHPFDVGSILDRLGIAVRTGHHCAQPLMHFLNIPGTVRASFSVYNTFEEVDRLYDGILKAKKMLDI